MVDSAHFTPHTIEETRPPPYKKTIKNAGKVLDHIKNGSVGKPSRHAKTSITYYDYRDGLISDPTHIYDSATIAALRHVPEDVQQRLILVEDLSNPMIDILGENFSINPEFFEEHLLNSGYAGGKYDSPPARNWSTSSFEKSYRSFRWIRPVYRLPTYFSSPDLEDLLLEDSVTHFTRKKSVTTGILTNIFRLEWGLWTDPATTSMMKRVCGLEERVSIWKKKLIDQNTEIVIVLLDPLPEISEIHHYWASTGSQQENDENKYKDEKEKKDDDDDDDDTSPRPSKELGQYWASTGPLGENGENDGVDASHYSSTRRSGYWTSINSQDSQGGNGENDTDSSLRHSVGQSHYRASSSSREENGGNYDGDASNHSSRERSQYWTPRGSQGENGENNGDDASHYSSTRRSGYWTSTNSQDSQGGNCGNDTDSSLRHSVGQSHYRASSGSRGENGENDTDSSLRHSVGQSHYRASSGSRGENGENDTDSSLRHSVGQSHYRASSGSREENGENDTDSSLRHSVGQSHYRASSSSQEENGGNDDGDASHYSSIEQRIFEEFIMDEEQPQRVRDETSFARALGWILGREIRKKFRPRQKLEVLDYIVEEKKKKRKPDVLNKVIIEQIAPRQPVSADLDCVFRMSQSMADLQAKLQETKSTKSGICEALRMHQGPVSLLRPLVQIIQQDTMTLLNQLRQVLDEIDIEILDDIMMEDRLSLWRQIINRAQRELPELRYSMEPFIEFLTKINPLSSPREVAVMELEAMQDIHELWKNIDHIVVRLERTSASLTSNMGLLESRRSIDEAHAVARLTELAFIFVPMSFAASVFGMQVQPFANPVPISNFFVVAVVVTSFAYLMRMTMRSHWLIALKAAVRNDVRKYAARNGQPVQPRGLPMLLIFRSIASRLGTIVAGICKWLAQRTRSVAEKVWAVFGFIISFVLLNGVASAIPIGLLWTRDLESDVRIAVSIPIVFIVIATVGVSFWLKSKPKFRSALPDLIMDRVRRAPSWLGVAVIYLILTAVFIVVPLALIWTRPLATGIKSGLTVGIVMTMVIIMLSLIAFGVTGRYRMLRFHS
ncbi:Mg2+ transporter protein CorA-like/Zinc transport protein ZntB [Penicillium robsamsonii]|uniref:Mg2+ transporter protein CorA-like/Zinc transport protein ZntB n=1 Tax=Penicillium robsamsonii TaxID=1792511 RepID=UPI0025465F41|nr:Mg2+ transporter protein CorA-like/Zinc transport protein ZntB [Penicillium robsamsonii]KAJ5822698.1 Mg2+ transporter protein CorA-like/Zinc transport protein ZntB [Penicillium robsamsonii]